MKIVLYSTPILVFYGFILGKMTSQQWSLLGWFVVPTIASAVSLYSRDTAVKVVASVPFLKNCNCLEVGVDIVGWGALLIPTTWVWQAVCPEVVHVQLVATDNSLLKGTFEIQYERGVLGPTTAVGVDGKLTLTDLPARSTEIVILGFGSPTYEPTQPVVPNSKLRIPIESHVATIYVRNKMREFPYPTPEECRELVEKIGVTRDEILATTLTDEQKKAVKLSILNQSGETIKVIICDCSWCYDPPPANSPKSYPQCIDIRFSDAAQPDKVFDQFGNFRTTSGICAVYVDWVDGGKWRRHPLGVFDLCTPGKGAFQIVRHEDVFGSKFIP